MNWKVYQELAIIIELLMPISLFADNGYLNLRPRQVINAGKFFSMLLKFLKINK